MLSARPSSHAAGLMPQLALPFLVVGTSASVMTDSGLFLFGPESEVAADVAEQVSETNN
jgi:hypothetical protein